MNPSDYIAGQPAIISSAGELNPTFRALHEAAAELLEQGGAEIRIKALEARTAAQNRAMWSALNDLARQANWHGVKMNAEAWKDMITASLKGQKSVPNMDGTGFVVIGGRTSKMSKKMLSDVIECVYALGSEQRVVFRDPKWVNDAVTRGAAAPSRAVDCSARTYGGET